MHWRFTLHTRHYLHPFPTSHPLLFSRPPRSAVLCCAFQNCTGTQPEVESLYKRFRSLDRARKGYISAEELMSIPELSINPLAQRLVRAGVQQCVLGRQCTPGGVQDCSHGW